MGVRPVRLRVLARSSGKLQEPCLRFPRRPRGCRTYECAELLFWTVTYVKFWTYNNHRSSRSDLAKLHYSTQRLQHNEATPWSSSHTVASTAHRYSHHAENNRSINLPLLTVNLSSRNTLDTPLPHNCDCHFASDKPIVVAIETLDYLKPGRVGREVDPSCLFEMCLVEEVQREQEEKRAVGYFETAKLLYISRAFHISVFIEFALSSCWLHLRIMVLSVVVPLPR